MTANTSTSIVLSSLDFDTIKNTYKTYLKSQDRFKDYDFDGSNLSVLLEMLALNTFHNSFFLNMVSNEAFMDSAQLRDSVVSHAKDLNYTPRSFKSSQAVVNISIVTSDMTKRSIVIPKGTSFTSLFGTKNYTFTVNENIILTDFVIGSNTITFTGDNIVLYEGYYVTDTFVYNYLNPARFTLSNKNVDVSSLAVTVIEDAGASFSTYSRTQSLFDITETSKVFFIQGAENDSYEIMFGDGTSGKKPKDNATIVVEYRISNGELPNGCNSFIPDSTIDGESAITISVVSVASAGSVSENIDSIKYNAPRHFATQERAVVTEDYETLLELNFPEINAVTAFGGEDLDPPQFGKVFIAVDLNDVDGLPEIKEEEYYRFLKPRSPVSIDPVFVTPVYTYIGVNSTVNYNINVTSLTTHDINTIVTSGITNYALANLNNFNRIFRYSKLVNAIDTSQISIISNDTTISVIKKITPDTGTYLTFDVDFGIELDTSKFTTVGGYTLKSSEFTYGGQKAILQDSNGSIQVVSAINNSLIDTVGRIDYTKGLVQFSNFKIEDYNNNIKIYGVPKHKDVSTFNNVVINIVEEDINLTVVPTRA